MTRYALGLSVIVCLLSVSKSAWCQTPSACPPNLEIATNFKEPLNSCFKELVHQISELDSALKVLQNRLVAVPNVLPVGTILASYLEPARFAEAIGESEGSALDKRTWILSDGREVIGTRFAIVTQGRPIPDLRGLFLRGIPAGGSRRAGDIQEYATALPKATFTGTTSKDGAITLPRSADPSGVDRYSAGGSPYAVITSGAPRTVDAHSHTVSITGGGDEETRPKNIAVYYYIKIN